MSIGLAAHRLGVWLEAQPEIVSYSERPWGFSKSGKEADFIAGHKTPDGVVRVAHSFPRRRSKAVSPSRCSEELAQAHQADLKWFDERADAELRMEVDNLTLMLPYVVQHARRGEGVVESAIIGAVADGPRPIKALENLGEGNRIVVHAAVFALHFRGEVHVGLRVPLDRNSVVSAHRDST
jgi:hypothetical protein